MKFKDLKINELFHFANDPAHTFIYCGFDEFETLARKGCFKADENLEVVSHGMIQNRKS